MSRENAEHVVHAHTDESGNTGHNLFDPSQPTFWTGTLLTERDPNTEAAEATAQAASSIGVGELHGADLGLDRVESVADILREQLVRLDSRLVFTRIEKRHYARLKLADTILDSGVNAAVSPAHYTNRLFRLSLALQLVVNVSPRSEEEFWRAYASLDIPAFQAVLGASYGMFRTRWPIRAAGNSLLMRSLGGWPIPRSFSRADGPTSMLRTLPPLVCLSAPYITCPMSCGSKSVGS